MKTPELADIVALLAETGDQDDSVQAELTVSEADKSLEELGFDSLALFNFAILVDKKYGVHLSFDELMGYSTITSLFEAIHHVYISKIQG
ncbi:acyl carrier protein [Prodigiosinella aquatilis]|nr:acyl carrier protein [Prodigiosinella sp. LS101]WJV55335.1 acyl carrier protein [Prodigiosinella sp. LS101]WJV59697.1 acyl carrier protein [Pectobacteriaceae bacterium C111]